MLCVSLVAAASHCIERARPAAHQRTPLRLSNPFFLSLYHLIAVTPFARMR